MTYKLKDLQTILSSNFYLDSEHDDSDYTYDFFKDFPEFIDLRNAYDSRYCY